MKKIVLQTTVKRSLADVHTPIGIYLRLRDRFRDTILLESADSHAAENSWSFIGINAIAGIEIAGPGQAEFKLPGREAERLRLQQPLASILATFMSHFDAQPGPDTAARFAQGLYGYTAFDVLPLVEKLRFREAPGAPNAIPLLRYRLYQYVIAINHHRDELLLCENQIAGISSEAAVIESLIASRDVPVFPFARTGEESVNSDDESYRELVRRGIAHCQRGDVFQIVLSRRFAQGFRGDEFNVYRALRHINPSPYLFFFDYGDYRLMGSSPEAQLILDKGVAIMHPIAGTFRRSGDDTEDRQRAEALLLDPKENAEHVMLVDLARNDLSTLCHDVEVSRYRQIQYYSHVIHLVSEVKGKVPEDASSFELLFRTFPAGTLSGAPKYRALQLINELEPTPRSYYGGAIGFMGFNGSCNQAIMIRTFLSRNNTLFYQAGAGVVAASDPERELQEVHNKLNALKNAITLAETIAPSL